MKVVGITDVCRVRDRSAARQLAKKIGSNSHCNAIRKMVRNWRNWVVRKRESELDYCQGGVLVGFLGW